jgi:hypothetical protein
MNRDVLLRRVKALKTGVKGYSSIYYLLGYYDDELYSLLSLELSSFYLFCL